MEQKTSERADKGKRNGQRVIEKGDERERKNSQNPQLPVCK
jgi:hypothetical protein